MPQALGLPIQEFYVQPLDTEADKLTIQISIIRL